MCKCAATGNQYGICIDYIYHSLTWNISGIKQKRSDEENWRGWSHRRHEESCQAGYKLFLRWVIKLIKSLWVTISQSSLKCIMVTLVSSVLDEILFFFFFYNVDLCFYSLVLPYSPYWILSTDYVNTALVYSCTDILRLFHVDFAWILSRTRTLPETTVMKAKETFANNNIDVSRMIDTKQEGCDQYL